MMDKEAIQSRGFRNVIQGDNTIGFQVTIRLMYYRSVWLSQLRAAKVTVDEEVFSGDQITWTIGGKVYEQADLAVHGDICWHLLEPAILTVKKPGGLAQGYHDVEVQYSYSSSYMPPNMDELIRVMHGPQRRRLLLV